MNASVPTKSVLNGYSRESDYTYAVASCSSLSSSWHSGSTHNTYTSRSFSNACNTADGYTTDTKTISFSKTITNATETETIKNSSARVTVGPHYSTMVGSNSYTGSKSITAPGEVTSASVSGSGWSCSYSGTRITATYTGYGTPGINETHSTTVTYSYKKVTTSPGSASSSYTISGYGIIDVSPTSGTSNGISWSVSYSNSTVKFSASGPNGTASANVSVTYRNGRTYKGTSSTSVSGTITGMSFVSGDAGSASYSGSTATVTWSGLSTSGTRSATYRINYSYTTSGYYTYYGSDTVRIPTGLTNANLTSCSRVSGTSATVSRVNSTHARCSWSGLSSSSASTNCRLNYSYDSPIYEDRADVTYVDSNGQSHDVDYINFDGNVYP